MPEKGLLNMSADMARYHLSDIQSRSGVQIRGGSRVEIRQTAEKFESLFISQMLAPMFQGLEPDPVFGGGGAEETWRGLLIEEYGKIISARGGLGIAHHVEAELLRMQEARSHAD